MEGRKGASVVVHRRCLSFDRCLVVITVPRQANKNNNYYLEVRKMGLTIHYSLKLGDGDYDLARERVEQLRQRALELPFERVDEVQHFVGDECAKTGDRLRWFGQLNTDDGEFPLVTPEEIIGFSVFPGEGCEFAVFGLRRRAGAGYDWQSFCKTAYTKGNHIEFLRCHLAVIALLDYAQELELVRWVRDESDYWERRDWVELLLNWRDCSDCEFRPLELLNVSKQLHEWFGPVREKAALVVQEE
jgi:hypothetical protein